MTKKHMLMAGALLWLTPTAFASPEKEKSAELLKEVRCAVMTEHKVNLKSATANKMYADYEGKRYYFCCGGCPEAFKKNPAKFAENDSIPTKLAIALEKTPNKPPMLNCAVMTANSVYIQDAIAKGMYADYKGKRYFFCCAGCPAAFKKDPAKFAKNDSIPAPKPSKGKGE
jgi:YHS domain-containing protein